MQKGRAGFTLIEWIVVVAIFILLLILIFVLIAKYSVDGRDAKRITDVSAILNEVYVESSRWVAFSDLIIKTNQEKMKVLWEEEHSVDTFGIANFKNIELEEKDYKDPSVKTQDYYLAYTVWSTWSGQYWFIEAATISERNKTSRILGNYYKLELDDAPSLFKRRWIQYEENWKDMVYKIDVSDEITFWEILIED